MHDHCKKDVEKFCASIKPGGGRTHKCLKENEAQLSEECKRASVSVDNLAKAEKQRERKEARVSSESGEN